VVIDVRRQQQIVMWLLFQSLQHRNTLNVAVINILSFLISDASVPVFRVDFVEFGKNCLPYIIFNVPCWHD